MFTKSTIYSVVVKDLLGFAYASEIDGKPCQYETYEEALAQKKALIIGGEFKKVYVMMEEKEIIYDKFDPTEEKEEYKTSKLIEEMFSKDEEIKGEDNMKDAIREECECGSTDFTVYKYENDELDYIECSKCGENIDWNVNQNLTTCQQIRDSVRGIYYSDVESKYLWQPFENYPIEEVEGFVDNDVRYWCNFMGVPYKDENDIKNKQMEV